MLLLSCDLSYYHRNTGDYITLKCVISALLAARNEIAICLFKRTNWLDITTLTQAWHVGGLYIQHSRV